MEPSVPGLLLLLALLALGRRLGGAILIGLFMSLPFGSTALGTLGALGGSSPLVYVAFIGLLLASVALRRGFAGRLAYVLSSHGTAAIVLAVAGETASIKVARERVEAQIRAEAGTVPRLKQQGGGPPRGKRDGRPAAKQPMPPAT